MVVVVLAIVVGLGTGVAYATGSSRSPGSGENFFYAQTGLDSVIHCASGHTSTAAVLPSPNTIDYETATSNWRDVFCANLEFYPTGYITSAVWMFRQGGSVCDFVDWQANSGPATGVLIRRSVSMCGGAGSFYTLGEHYNAVNLGWRYGDETTAAVPGS